MSFANSVILYNCKLNHNGLFCCDFASAGVSMTENLSDGAARDSIMGSTNAIATVKFSYSSMTYIRKDKVIVVDENADVLDAAGVNYCRYINSDFNSSMYFYAFIDKIEYVAPSTSRLHIRTDCWMTWFDKIIPNECFIERQHPYRDLPFDVLTTPEDVGVSDTVRVIQYRLLGDALNSGDQEDGSYSTNRWYAAFNLAGDVSQIGLSGEVNSSVSAGSPCGTNWYVVSVDQLKAFAAYLENKGHIQDVMSIILLPRLNWTVSGREIVSFNGMEIQVDHLDGGTGPYRYLTLSPSFYYATMDDWSEGGRNTNNTIFLSLNRYIQEFDELYNNRKLLSYPYSSFEFFTFDGSSIILAPQDCMWNYTSDGYGFQIRDVINGGSTPTETCFIGQEGINGSVGIETRANISFSAFPNVQASADGYNNYIARNQNSLKFQKSVINRERLWKGTQLAGDAFKNFAKLISTNGAAGGGDLLDNLHGALAINDSADAIAAKMEDAKTLPDGVVGQSSEDSLFRNGRLGIYFAIRRLRSYALIDQFFDRYGYKANTIQKILWNTRPKFNYVKTAGANIAGEIPESDKETINSLFDAGITIWHSPDDYGTYDGANNRAPER